MLVRDRRPLARVLTAGPESMPVPVSPADGIATTPALPPGFNQGGIMKNLLRNLAYASVIVTCLAATVADEVKTGSPVSAGCAMNTESHFSLGMAFL